MDGQAVHLDALLRLSVGDRQCQMTVEEYVREAYEAHRTALYRYFVTLGIPPESAQDLGHDVFIDLYVALRNGVVPNNARAWLFAVGSRAAIDFLRRESARSQLIKYAAAMPATHHAAGENAEAALLKREQMAALAAAIGNRAGRVAPGNFTPRLSQNRA